MFLCDFSSQKGYAVYIVYTVHFLLFKMISYINFPDLRQVFIMGKNFHKTWGNKLGQMTCDAEVGILYKAQRFDKI